MNEEKKSFIKKYWWIGALSLAVIALLFVGSKVIFKDSNIKKQSDKEIETVEKSKEKEEDKEAKSTITDPDNPPKFIQADWVELDKVFMISKFRSGSGHDYSLGSGETCRSMKHYFASMDPNQPDYKKLGGGDKEKYPPPTLEKDVKIFSPVDGTIKFVSFDDIAFNNELSITPDDHPDVNIRLQHVQAAPGVKEGKVKAGELVGLVLANQSFDLAIEAELKGTGKEKSKTGYISYFAALPDNIFAKYQARGAKTRDDFIISKEYRDANPFSCHGKEEFDQNYAFLNEQSEKENLFYLSGYKKEIKEGDKSDKK